jgi:hypothetical protein
MRNNHLLGTYTEHDGPTLRPVGGKVLCSDYRVRVLKKLSRPDTFFSMSGTVKANGKSVSGLLTLDHGVLIFNPTRGSANYTDLPLWDKTKLVGLSCSRCIKDMIYGDINPSNVAFLYASTYIRTQRDVEEVVKAYSQISWALNEEEAERLLRQFLNSGRYYQWRPDRWANVIAYPYREEYGYTLLDGREIILPRHWVPAYAFFAMLEQATIEEKRGAA